MPSINASWRRWVRENLNRNCDMEDILARLLQEKFPLREIRMVMGRQFPSYSLLLGERPPVDYAKVNNVRLTREARKVPAPGIELYEVESFLNMEECALMVDLIQKHHRPSTVVAKIDDPYYRTSTTCDLSLLRDKRVLAVEEKIAAFAGINPSYADGIEGQRYEVGQEFRPHADYFTAGKPEHDELLRRRGNRTWTFMIYLNDVPKGGGTRFPNIDVTFLPKAGNAVAWNNLTPEGKTNPQTLHWGMPVEEGEKMVLTKWFRERGNGEMLLA